MIRKISNLAVGVSLAAVHTYGKGWFVAGKVVESTLVIVSGPYADLYFVTKMALRGIESGVFLESKLPVAAIANSALTNYAPPKNASEFRGGLFPHCIRRPAIIRDGATSSGIRQYRRTHIARIGDGDGRA